MPLNDLVFTAEHPNSIGKIIRVNELGDLTIEFTTLPADRLPFGHIGLEFWPVSDHSSLVPFFEVTK